MSDGESGWTVEREGFGTVRCWKMEGGGTGVKEFEVARAEE